MVTDQKILEYFKTADPVIYSILPSVDLQHWKRSPSESDHYFQALVSEIISQQLNTKVAKIIKARFEQLLGTRPFIPATIVGIEDIEFRAVGLSKAKTVYVKNLASKSLSGELNFSSLSTLSEAEVITELTKLKGIGRWTAEMFLIFGLGKEDIFSYGDWGLKTAIKNLYHLADYPTEVEANKISSNWKPYRSYASFALWKSLEKKD